MTEIEKYPKDFQDFYLLFNWEWLLELHFRTVWPVGYSCLNAVAVNGYGREIDAFSECELGFNTSRNDFSWQQENHFYYGFMVMWWVCCTEGAVHTIWWILWFWPYETAWTWLQIRSAKVRIITSKKHFMSSQKTPLHHIAMTALLMGKIGSLGSIQWFYFINIGVPFMRC